jgi:hypothetical protein
MTQRRFQENDQYLDQAKKFHKYIRAVFTDGVYVVEQYNTSSDSPFLCRLAISRLDKSPIRRWQDIQDIKNEIAGEDAVAIEVYPRESKVTDTANIYHLWILDINAANFIEQEADLAPYEK